MQGLIQYTYPSTQIWKAWAATKDLEAFTGKWAEMVITNILRKAVLPLQETITAVKSKLVTATSNFDVCAQYLLAMLSQFASEKNMGENFIL